MRGTRPLLSVFAHCKPDENGCWIWQLAVNSNGYGSASAGDGKKAQAHRLAWKERHGSLPPKGVFVCHKCDVPLCVNPDHLFLGTHQENMDDMVRKGRNTTGERVTQAKLTAAQVLEIRAASGSIYEIAPRYGISFQQVSRIRRRERWAHL